MKKGFIALLLPILSFSAVAQKAHRILDWEITKATPKNNEVKLNLPTTIFGLFPEISYERIVSTDVSLGASLGFSLDGADNYPLYFQFTPYARWFFGGNNKSMQKSATGFFIEFNSVLLSAEKQNGEYQYGDNTFKRIETKHENKLGAGLGLALGWKYLNNSNWVGEIVLGGGREFINDGAYPRFGISIGKRF